jgi:predicted dehydrogenase
MSKSANFPENNFMRQNLSLYRNRRSFLKSALAAGTVSIFAPNILTAAGRGEKVRLACVGIGNRGWEDLSQFHATGRVDFVALCDTDMGAPHTQKALKLLPNVPRFRDFRKMFDELSKNMDAVCIGTPDFSHFPIAMLAMSLGKHVYCEKPMGHSFRQVELMMAAEKKYGVAAQMGNQGHSEANYFQFKAWTEAGIIKNVTKITAFMNSARRWHGMKVDGFLPAEPVPASLDWDCWLATAKEHAYNHGYVNGEWRSWFDFGNGALGDWGAHIFDTAHEFLQLGLPTEVEAVKLEGWSPFIFPQASTLAFRFPARGVQPPVELDWYDGQQNLPLLPDNMGASVVDPNIPPPSTGSIDITKRPPGKIIYGEGLTFKGGSHGATLQIIPSENAREIASKLPPVPKSPSNHYVNFLRACTGEEKCRSNFAVAGPLCQTMALGILAQRVNARLEFDPGTRQITNHKLANDLLAGVPPRPDWEQYYKLA